MNGGTCKNVEIKKKKTFLSIFIPGGEEEKEGKKQEKRKRKVKNRNAEKKE